MKCLINVFVIRYCCYDFFNLKKKYTNVIDNNTNVNHQNYKNSLDLLYTYFFKKVYKFVFLIFGIKQMEN